MNCFRTMVVALWFCGLFQNNAFAAADESSLKIGDVPPPLVLSETVQGVLPAEISWDKLKGKVVVLEFWNTGCGPCVQAIPHWNELVEEFKNKRVVFISISDDNADYLKKFLKRKPIKGWVVLDGSLNPTQTAFGLQDWPHTVVVDASGKIAANTHPMMFKALNLEQVLAGKPCSLLMLNRHYTNSVSAVIVTNLAPNSVEFSIAGPFSQPKGAFDFHGWNTTKSFPDFEAKKAFLIGAISSFYGISPKLIAGNGNLPEGLYDISAAAPPDKLPELKSQFAEKLKTSFDIEIQIKKRNVDVYVMTLASTNAPGRKQVQNSGGGGRAGGISMEGTKMDILALILENYLDRTVINETALAGYWAVDVKWPMSYLELNFDADPNPEKVIQAVREQLGLELTPTNRTLEVLQVSKVKN